ncbi:MAG: hypothetical protein NC244_13540, partial [Alistipes senegalensis]|nr:hypothetical protein [Alistipes senegalensis]
RSPEHKAVDLAIFPFWYGKLPKNNAFLRAYYFLMDFLTIVEFADKKNFCLFYFILFRRFCQELFEIF